MLKPASPALLSLAAFALCAIGYAFGSRAASQGAAPTAKSPSPLDHLKLDEGVWDTTVSIATDPASPPMVIQGTQTNTMACDGRWLIGDFQSDSFQGHGIMGWDAQKKKYVSVWVDAESPSMQTGEGTYSADGKTRTMMVEGADGSGKVVKMREVHVVSGPDSRSLTIFAPGADGKESVALSIEYKRHHSH